MQKVFIFLFLKYSKDAFHLKNSVNVFWKKTNIKKKSHAKDKAFSWAARWQWVSDKFKLRNPRCKIDAEETVMHEVYAVYQDYQ